MVPERERERGTETKDTSNRRKKANSDFIHTKGVCT